MNLNWAAVAAAAVLALSAIVFIAVIKTPGVPAQPHTLAYSTLSYSPGECSTDADCSGKGPGFICNASKVCEWKPPIGIPKPTFGIEETYRMYDTPSNRNPNLTYYQNSEGGYYTHYIDKTHHNATDSGNPYGTASKPRLTIPAAYIGLYLAAGSVVEVHGGPYTDAYILKTSSGTLDRPVFIRGINEDNMPVISFQLRVAGSYLILENLDFFNGGSMTFHGNNAQDFMAIRYSEFHNSAPYHPIWINTARNIVVYNNNIHDNGNWESPTETGYQGVALYGGGETNKIWVVDNHIHHNGEDGLQTMVGQPKHVYIGRNVMNHNRENAVDIKVGQHVIISQNTFYGYRRTDSSGGDAIRPNDEGAIDNIWILFNDIYDSTIGIETWHTPFPPYIIGNKFHDLVGTTLSGTYYPSKGIEGGSAGPIVNNVIYNVDVGIAEKNAVIVNNIISNASMYHIDSDFEMRKNLLWQNGEEVTIRGTAPCIDCIEADPLFVDAANGDFHLQSASPAIDSGTESNVYQTFYDLYGIDIRKDIEGRTRPQGSAWDIGAYEYTSLTQDSDGDDVADPYDLCPSTPAGAAVSTRGCPMPIATKFDIKPGPSADLSRIDSLEIGISAYGKIAYNRSIRLMKTVFGHYEPVDLDSNINISRNMLDLNSSNLPMLNISATITMYNVSLSNPVILRDGSNCTACTITQWNRSTGTLQFTVPYFTVYSLAEGVPGPYCGDGLIDPGEQCDGNNITSTCQSLGYTGGTIACYVNCTLNTASCYSPAQPGQGSPVQQGSAGPSGPSGTTGACSSGSIRPCSNNTGACRAGWQSCTGGQWNPCNGTMASGEICDGKDNDCNGQADNGISCDCLIGQTRPCGSDIGACIPGTRECLAGRWGDCEGSSRPTIELCGDNIDNDCNGTADDNCTEVMEAICKDGPIPQLGCYCGAKLHTYGYCYNSVFSETKREFPWLLLSLLGSILLCVLLVELIWHQRKKMADLE